MRRRVAITPARPEDPLPAALCAAELGTPFPLDGATAHRLITELSEALPALRATVPYATLRLLEHLAIAGDAPTRAQVARALPPLVDVYPDRVERLLLPLACDDHREVRAAATVALAEILLLSRDASAWIARWERYSPRAQEVLQRARRHVPLSLET